MLQNGSAIHTLVLAAKNTLIIHSQSGYVPSSPLVLVGPAVLGPGTYQVNDFGDAGCEKSLRKKEKKGDITTDVQRTTGEGENHKSLRVSIWV